jgi:seryl-tRNA synthetase
MLDIKLLREDPDGVKALLAKRGYTFDVPAWQALEASRKTLQVSVENLQHERTLQSKKIGELKQAGQKAETQMQAVKTLGDELEAQKHDLDVLLAEQEQFLLLLPNIPHASVPVGTREADNQVVYEWGLRPEFDYPPCDHVSLGERHQYIDFDSASALSGSRFVVLKGDMALLHRALGQFMLDVHTKEHGYVECYVPYLVDPACLVGTGQLPKFSADLFQTNNERGLYLIPTAEVPLTNLVRERILEDLPLKFTAHTPCFRSEAGSYGKDTKGMFRQHQFDKVELVQIVHPNHSYDALEALTQHAENILQKLQLSYRKMVLCTGDMGGHAAKTYDLEVWLPGQNQYREISSCSNCESYQARRMMTRFRSGDKKTDYVHTLNGSGLAVGRTLIAVLENYQQQDGSIRIPDVLVPYMNKKRVI